MDSTPDYYAVLGVSPTSSREEVKAAYKKQSLLSHPDRFPNVSASERARYTSRFQSVADAYYVLSDPTRRAEYDELRKERGGGGWGGAFPGSADWEKAETEQGSSARFFQGFFGGGAGAAGSSAGANMAGTGTAQPEANNVFSDVFEELLRPEVQRVVPMWKWIGSASGASLGFIVGNIPGAVAGTFLGNRLGAIRDAKGRSVGSVFMDLNSGQRAEVLKALAMKVLGSIG